MKGNCYNQLILTNNELYNYIAKYTCKPENTGSQLEKILRAILANEYTHNLTNAYIQILNLFQRVQSERNISSQEACLLLQKVKLFESSLFLVKIDLYPPRQIQTRFVHDIAQASTRLQETTPNLAPTRQNIIQTLESDTTTSYLPLVTNASFDTSVDQGHHNEIGPFFDFTLLNPNQSPSTYVFPNILDSNLFCRFLPCQKLPRVLLSWISMLDVHYQQ